MNTKKFKITCIKVMNITSLKNSPNRLIEQIIYTDQDPFNYEAPAGYAVLQICEIKEEIRIITNKESSRKAN